MADEGTSTAGSTQSTTGESQPAQTTQADSISIPRSEYETYVRNTERLKGADTFYSKARSLGFKSAEDFDTFAPKFKTLSELEKKGYGLDKLGRLISDEAEEDIGTSKNHQQFDAAKFEKDFEAKIERKIALKEWENLSQKEKDHVDSALRDYFGDEKVDDFTKQTYRLAVERYMDSIRDLYPENHPLAGERLQPLTDAHAKKAVEYFKSEKAKFAGANAAAKADSIISSERKAPTQSAGRSGYQGAPEKKKLRPGQIHDDDAIAAKAAQIQARRAAGGR